MVWLAEAARVGRRPTRFWDHAPQGNGWVSLGAFRGRMPAMRKRISVVQVIGPLLLVVLVPHFAASVCAQQAPVEDRYQRTIKAAVAEFQSGHWSEARALFGDAHALKPSARTHRGLGMAEFELRNYVEAITQLSASLTSQVSPLTTQQRSGVQELVRRAEAFIGRYQAFATPGAVLRVDGHEPVFDSQGRVLLNVGKHTLVATLEGHNQLSQVVDVRGGEDQQLTFAFSEGTRRDSAGVAAPPAAGETEQPAAEPPASQSEPVASSAAPPGAEPPPPSSASAPGVEASEPEHTTEAPPPEPASPGSKTASGGRSAWPLVLMIAGGVGLIGGAVSGVAALGKAQELADGCDPNNVCGADLKESADQADRFAAVSDVLFVVGVAAAGVGLTWWLVSGPDSKEEDAPAVSLRLAPGAAQLVGRF